MAEAGCILDVGCPKCGQRDDLHHRLWACEGEDVKQARERALAKADAGRVGRAVAATPGNVHPWVGAPRPQHMGAAS